MDQENLIKTAKAAEQIANNVEDPYRAVLFAVALEKLLSGGGERVRVTRETEDLAAPFGEQKNGKKREEIMKSVLSAYLELSPSEKQLMEKQKTLERSMLALDIVQKRFGVEELMPSEISKILSGNWGEKTTPNAISMALKGAVGHYVNRGRSAQGYAYSLTPAGRAYIGTLKGEG